jgi:hypothetical protein
VSMSAYGTSTACQPKAIKLEEENLEFHRNARHFRMLP